MPNPKRKTIEMRRQENELRFSLDLTILAHCEYPKVPSKASRIWDKTTPYAIHPIWCAMTLLTETTLSAEIREIGYQVLLFHDISEETQLPIPKRTNKRVKKLLEEMTFESFEDEIEKLSGRSDLANLLKLYDKVSNLLDGSWMSASLRKKYINHTLRLADFVLKKYGKLNIVRIARAISA